MVRVMNKRRYISKESLQQLALAGGIRSLSKKSINTLSDIFLTIMWSIIEHGIRITEKRNGKNTTAHDIVRGLKVFQEQVKKTDYLLQERHRCQSFNMKMARYNSYENYTVKKLEFYKNLKECSFLNDQSYNELILMVLNKIKFPYKLNDDSRTVIKKITEKVYKRFMRGLSEDLEDQGKTILKSNNLNEVWAIFKTTREIIALPDELKDNEWYYKTKNEKEAKNEDLVNQFLVDENTISEESESEIEEADNVTKNINDILWPALIQKEAEPQKEDGSQKEAEPQKENDSQTIQPKVSFFDELMGEPMEKKEQDNTEVDNKSEDVLDISTEINVNTVNFGEDSTSSSSESNSTSDGMDENDILEDAAHMFKDEIDDIFRDMDPNENTDDNERNKKSDLVESELNEWDIEITDDDELEKELRNI